MVARRSRNRLSNEELPYKAAKADCERLRGELAASEATVRVHEFTIRNVSTARDTASASLEAARGLIGYSADALAEFAAWSAKHLHPAPTVTAFVAKLRAFLAAAPPVPVEQLPTCQSCQHEEARHTPECDCGCWGFFRKGANHCDNPRCEGTGCAGNRGGDHGPNIAGTPEGEREPETKGHGR